MLNPAKHLRHQNADMSCSRPCSRWAAHASLRSIWMTNTILSRKKRSPMVSMHIIPPQSGQSPALLQLPAMPAHHIVW